tara:strand:- start:2699 stop:3964 length:1266 start_codon:yes stop_codon:yes gene_type:complete
VESYLKSKKIFYGWWLLVGSTGVMVMQGAFNAYGFPVFFVPLAASLGTNRGLLSMAFSFSRLESSLLGPFEGYLIDKLGPRKIMYLGFAIWGLGFLLFSRVNSITTFFMVFPIIALGASLAGFLPAITAVNNWFSKRRAFATGITSAGVNLGGILVALLVLSISSIGWQSTSFLLGIIIWIAGFPLAKIIRHKPQDYGYLPDGELDPVVLNENLSSDNYLQVESSDFSWQQALKTPAFWLLASAHGFSLFIVGTVSIHQMPLLDDAGITFEMAGTIVAIMTAIAMAGRVLGGYLGDKFGRKLILLACFSMMSIGVLLLATTKTVSQSILYAFFYGLGYGARAPILVALRGEYFGPKNFATIMGLSQPIMVIGTFFGPVAAGYAYDLQGSYTTIFTIIAGLNMIGAILVFFIKPPSINDYQS